MEYVWSGYCQPLGEFGQSGKDGIGHFSITYSQLSLLINLLLSIEPPRVVKLKGPFLRSRICSLYVPREDMTVQIISLSCRLSSSVINDISILKCSLPFWGMGSSAAGIKLSCKAKLVI